MALATAAALATGLAYLDAKYHLSKDMSAMRAHRAIVNSRSAAVKNDRVSPYHAFAASATRNPTAEAIWTRTGSYTWADVLTQSHRYAHFFLARGVRREEFVALCMQNSADYIFAWLGLLAIGAAPAMINHNLADEALLGCLRTSKAKIILVDGNEELLKRVADVQEGFQSQGVTTLHLPDIRDELSRMSSSAPEDALRKGLRPGDPMALFYTSGTTGMPKACILPIAASFSLIRSNELGLHPVSPKNERCYVCMPFYHGTGGITMLSQILCGSTVCVAPKFSASSFWPDIRASKATWFLYVGETLRYLLAAPPSPDDKAHTARAAYGNGCRPDVWTRFQARFGIDTLGEFYNSTEGPLALRNLARGEFLAHAVGHLGLLMRWRYRDQYVFAAVDPDTGEVWRDAKTGLVVRSPHQVGGEVLVVMPGERPFPGYYGDEKATEKKYIRDVLKKGDLYYRTGDAMRMDADGRWFFLDRLGDTFRWKGENVSTAEVAQVLGAYPGVHEAVVYGVELPCHDGKAGAAALHLDPSARDKFDYAGLLKHARSKLPKYAVPIFLRILQNQTASHNNKQNKAPLKRDGVDPRKVQIDQLFWIEKTGKGQTYVPFRQQDWDGLVAGKAKL
ncbi:AMP-binding enzyme [Sodiomyces alkalinus F11]|uniref:Very long-chain fatty acid transport protein n=1 Tax=Sodiomyces alkalinus (strain CBS 110278 / VKM F-3762 / F11) TaxID=1314773 RepID=A0A3N2Q7N5_SODAK|nr:AMP-binding enzyme [Sodiomyces alkalinus F11]ROT42645.1 AMP-binding enzyme [Sodiomyces alkalinus F11]